MLTLIQGARIYAPEETGTGDVLIGCGKILRVAPQIEMAGLAECGPVSVIDARGLIAVPGIVDQHVHFLGAGGASGPQSRVEELHGDELLSSGVTTAVGLLGMDTVARSLSSLYAKAQALEAVGVSSYLYTGAFVVPSPTFTGSVRADLLLIDKVIGVKVAIADATASSPTVEELSRLANDAYAGGRLAGKAGVLHIHLGLDDNPYPLLRAVLNRSKVPPSQFILCHVNYSRALLEGAQAFIDANTFFSVDSTLDPALGRTGAIPPAQAIIELLEGGVPLDRIVLQSDANGSQRGLVNTLLSTLRTLITEYRVGMTELVHLASVNPAVATGLNGSKGYIAPGKDADVLLLTEELVPACVISKGIQRGPSLCDDSQQIRLNSTVIGGDS